MLFALTKLIFNLILTSCGKIEDWLGGGGGVWMAWRVGYSDYDVFLENDEDSQVYRCKKLF
jgi:hypothetical protein